MTTGPAPVRHWACPACGTTSTTQRHEPHTEMHACDGVGGLWTHLVEVDAPGARPEARQIPVLGRVNGLTVASVRTEHASGRIDTHVILSPAAR